MAAGACIDRTVAQNARDAIVATFKDDFIGRFDSNSPLVQGAKDALEKELDRKVTWGQCAHFPAKGVTGKGVRFSVDGKEINTISVLTLSDGWELPHTNEAVQIGRVYQLREVLHWDPKSLALFITFQ